MHAVAPTVALAVVTLVATACAAGSAGEGSGRGRTAQAPRLVPTAGGTITVGLDSVPTTLNDHTVAGDTAVGRMVASAVWAQVFRVAPGLTPQLDTNVVDSAEVVSLAPQTVVYQIDPRATWSDGVPVTVDDFAYAWQSQKGGAVDIDGTPDSVASSLGYRDIASVTGTNGGRTVTVVFHTAFADWASLFDDLLPAHIAERSGWNHGFDSFDPGVLVSAGPWQVTSWQPGTKIVLGRNPHWWAGPVSLDRVVIRAEAGPQQAASALGGGQLQVAYPGWLDQSFLSQVSSSPVLQSQESLGTTMLQLEFNLRRPPLDNVAVREGIAHDVDRATLVTTVGQPEDPSVWEDNHHLFANMQSSYVDDAAGYERADPAAASRLLAQGGLQLDTRGTWSSHGRPLSLTLVWASDDSWSAAVGPVVAAQLVSQGFDVTAAPVTSAQLTSAVLPNGAFDLAIVPVAVGAYPSEMAAVFSTAPSVTGGAGPEDWSSFDDPRVDTLFSQAVQQLSPPQALAIYQQIDQTLWSAMPTLPLFAEPTLVVTSASLAQVGDDPGGLGPLWNMRLWTRLAAAPSHRTTTSQATGRLGRG
jgi:peptide/nickel transport system substrate-binding protein